jgi:hypothetical protein
MVNTSINMDKRKFLIITQAIFIADISIFLLMFRIRTICFLYLSLKQNCAAVYFCYGLANVLDSHENEVLPSII